MKYATWKLNFSNSNYGTGPESAIVQQGGSASAGLQNDPDIQRATILGYFDGKPTNLEVWQFEELTQEEALNFVLVFDDTAYISENGEIAVVYLDDQI
jgi:hypothetical protein